MLMKVLKSVSIVVFSAIIVLPLIFFNFEPNSVSEIDNRLLADNPFTNVEGDVTKSLENYVGDRIGFRDEIILGYTLLNDKLFGKMTHPSYTYGKNGYVFGAGITTKGIFSDYHIVFADMVAATQEYCEDRGVPFLFVFNPAKPAVLSEYIKDGINYSRDWVDLFFAELDKRGVNYLDNTKTLKSAKENGVTVYNQKYDANHWNYFGAFHGTNAMLESLKSRVSNIHINDLSEFEVSEEIMKSLPVSNFPINEAVPLVELKSEVKSLSDKYRNELNMHPSYRTFNYFLNEQRKAEGAPRALVFQGSYMNGFGYKYLANSFSEYISVHDYQNIIDLPYYFNIFKTDCVIFEVAEYTFNEIYFAFEEMKKIDYNKPLEHYKELNVTERYLTDKEITVTKGEVLTEILWSTSEDGESVWLLLGKEYDMKKTEGGYAATVSSKDYTENADKLRISLLENDEMTNYIKK